MKFTKLLIGVLLVLLLVHSALAVSDASELRYSQESWFQKLTSLFVVSGSDKAVNGEVKTYYEIVDNYVLDKSCVPGTVSKAEMLMVDSSYNVIEDSGVLTRPTTVCGADAFPYSFIMHNGNPFDLTVKIIGKVYCEKTSGGYGWVTDPHPKTVIILNGGCKSTGCPSNGFNGVKYCYGGNVYRNYRTYTCGSDGNCHSSTIKKLVEDCNSMSEKCNLDTGDACVRSDYCYSNSDCHNPYYSESYCDDNNIVKDYISFSCENHYCISHSNKVMVKECGVNEGCESGVCVQKAYCGDGVCNNGESYDTCPADCSQPNTPTGGVNVSGNTSEDSNAGNNNVVVKKSFSAFL